MAGVEADRDAFIAVVEVKHLVEQLAEVHMFELEFWRSGIVREGLDHLLHALDLLYDGVGGTVQHLGILAGHGIEVFVSQALCGKLDRGQRIFDLVGQAPGHFSPGRIALCLDQGGNIVEDDHMLTMGLAFTAKRGAPADEDLAAIGAKQYHFGLPGPVFVVELGGDRLDQWLKYRIARLQFCE